MPCNIYGPGDNYNLNTSHFLPAMLKKVHLLSKNGGKVLNLWGNGKPKREVLFSRDFADACIYFMNKKHNNHLINIGSNEEYTIHEFAVKVLKMFNLKNKIKYNNKLSGTMRKKLDLQLSKKLGWKAQTKLDDGLKITYEQDYQKINEV